PDRHLAELGHGPDQQPVGLRRTGIRGEVVRALEEEWVDLLEVDEVLDLDRPARLGRERLEVLVRDHHVLARRHLVSLHDLLARDLVAARVGDLAVPDPGPGPLLELVEAHVAAPGCGQDLDRHADEPEADGSTPDGARHPQLLRWPPPSLAPT